MSSQRPKRGPGTDRSFVAVVDDEAGVRQALDSLFRSIDLDTRLFASPAELFEAELPDAPGCLLLDVRLPGASGLDLHDRLVRRKIELPIVYMTGYGDIPMSVRAMKAGAVDFLAKPFRDQDVLDAVAAAIERDRDRRTKSAALSDLSARFDTLTPREREVMGHVVSGLMNKQVAGLIGLSEITVKIHRGNAMRKMNARSLADLVRQAEALGLFQEQNPNV